MKPFFIACLLCCVAEIASAQTDTPRFLSVDSIKAPRRMGSWLCHDGDDPRWASPQFNDATWALSKNAKIDLKTDTPFRFTGIAWFRKRIRIDSSLVGVPVALMVKHGGASEIFLDGDSLTSNGRLLPRDSAEYYNPQLEPFVFAFREPGEHIFAIRYAEWNARASSARWGERQIDLTVQISNANAAVTMLGMDYLFDFALLMTLTALFATLGFIHLILWLYYRAARSNLSFAIFSLSLATLCFLLVLINTANNPVKIAWAGRLTPHVALITFVSLSAFINALFGRRKWRFRVVVALAVLSAFLILIPYENELAGFLPLILVFLVFIETLVLTISGIHRRIPGARIIGAGLLFVSLFVFGIFTFTSVTGKNVYFTPSEDPALTALLAAVVLAIPVSMSVYLAWSFATLNKRLKAELIQVETLSSKSRAQEEERQRMLEVRQEELEHEVSVRTEQLRGEKEKSDTLLLNILPEEVAEELKEKGFAQAKHHDEVSVLFTDFVEFTRYSEHLAPAQIVEELDSCFRVFDAIIERHGLEKIKTIGDGYMAVAGLPVPHADGATAAVRAALDMRDHIRQRRAQNPDTFDIRIGVHSGPVVAGIVGVKKFAYDVWGDTVNTASRMEQSGEAGRVNISNATHALVQESFMCIYRGQISAKGKNAMEMYFVEATLVAGHAIA